MKIHPSTETSIPSEGIHSYRVCNIAIIDFALTLLLAMLISRATGKKVWFVFTALLLLSVVVHKLVGVSTTFTKAVF